MPQLIIPLSQNWTVRLPVAARQMQKHFVEAFFADGSLRLASFEAFRQHPHERRRDEQEGTVVMEIAEPNGTLSFLGANGQEAYVLCASVADLGLTNDDMSVGYIRINDTVSFAAAVSRQIPGFVGGVEGLCRYSHDRVVRKNGNRAIEPPKNGAEAEAWFRQQNDYVGEQAIDGFFLKDAKFSHESEYRFIWFAEGQRREFIDIKCPAAIKYCEPG